MVTRKSRILLGLASLLSAVGGVMHALAFTKAATVIGASGLPRFYRGSSESLWLADSATLFILAVIFGLTAARPPAGARPVIMLVSLIPAATAILLYIFLGNFFAGHLLMAIAALAFIAGARLRELPQLS